MTIAAPTHSPLTSDSEVGNAPSAVLRDQLRFELWQVKRETGVSNETLAGELGYQSASSVAKWLNDLAPVSKPCADALDRMGRRPTIGGSFAALHRAYTVAKRGLATEPARGPRTYDVFLASPMASSGSPEEYTLERRAARDVKVALENFCDLSVYYAGDSVESGEEFAPADVAAEQNFEALENSRRFLLMTLASVQRPSSIHVEAGYALARKLPSLYLVRDHAVLPFVLGSLGQHKRNEVLPPVSVQYVNSGARAVSLIRRHGDALFTRLDGKRSPSAKRPPRSRRSTR